VRSIVEITPQDVQQKQFDYVKRGFDPQQVGVFLDQMAAALAKRDRAIHEARTEIEALGSPDTEADQNREAFRLTLTVATKTMEEMLRMAGERAAQIEEEARAAAQTLVERAQIDAEDKVASITREIESLEAERDRLEAQVAERRAAAADLSSRDSEEKMAERPPLELVVDRGDGATPSGEAGLAARVGDLRG
jgi:cell division initiation protein